MDTTNLSSYNTIDLIKELSNRGALTKSKTNTLILNSKDDNNSIQVILTKGIPQNLMECRECCEMLDAGEFSYYLSRVDKNGYLMRSNALCNSCSSKSNKDRKDVLDRADIPKKPKSGDICPSCNRSWNGNWHRHHEGDEFKEWLCGHCNMSLSDQRNKKNSTISNE